MTSVTTKSSSGESHPASTLVKQQQQQQLLLLSMLPLPCYCRRYGAVDASSQLPLTPIGCHDPCTLESFGAMAARAAELMGVEHLGLGSDLCQNQPDSVVKWMRNGRWTEAVQRAKGWALSD